MASGYTVQQAALERRALIAATALLCIGVLLRINHLLGERAFWYDELSVLANLMGRNYAQLAAPLDVDQVAPFGFLVVVKWFGETLGFSELAVRLPITLVSLIGLGSFYLVTRQICGRATTLVALLLLATNNWLVYYAAETKQYAFDVTAAVLIYLVAIPLLREWTTKRTIGLGLLGVVAVWFSHPAAFVLGAVGLVLIGHSVSQRQYRQVATLSAFGLLWLASFAAHLWFSSALGTQVTANQQNLYWANNFMPFPPTGVSEVMWYWRSIVGLFSSPLGFQTAGLAAVVATAGAWTLWHRSPALTLMLVMPLAIALLASWVRLYPFTGRLLLFAAPAMLLLIAQGIVLGGTCAWRNAKILWVVGMVVLLLHPLGSTARQAAAHQPYLREGLPEVLADLQANAEPDDRIHLYGSAEKSFRFYAPRYGLDELPLSIVARPKDDWQVYIDSLQPLVCQPRVWLVFAHITRQPIDHERLLLQAADKLGGRLRSVSSSHESPLKDSLHGAAAHLYDLRGPHCYTARPHRGAHE